MDIDTVNIGYMHLSGEQMNQYRCEGKCFNCHQKGHMSCQCPRKKSNGSNSTNWRKGGGGNRKPSRNIHYMETVEEEQQTQEEENAGTSNTGGDIAHIRAMIEELDDETKL